MYGFDTADARIPVGNDGEVLTADSSEALGVKWAPGTPSSSAVIQSLQGRSFTDLAAAPTHIVFTDQGGYDDGTYFEVDGSGDLAILLPGVYRVEYMSRQWVFGPLATSNWEWLVTGDTGIDIQYSTNAYGINGTMFASVAGRIADAGGAIDVTLGPLPDLMYIVSARSGASFPIVQSAEVTFFVDEVETATTFPQFGFMVTRLGEAYE